jgi:hypothetical protein
VGEGALHGRVPAVSPMLPLPSAPLCRPCSWRARAAAPPRTRAGARCAPRAPARAPRYTTSSAAAPTRRVGRAAGWPREGGAACVMRGGLMLGSSLARCRARADPEVCVRQLRLHVAQRLRGCSGVLAYPLEQRAASCNSRRAFEAARSTSALQQRRCKRAIPGHSSLRLASSKRAAAAANATQHQVFCFTTCQSHSQRFRKGWVHTPRPRADRRVARSAGSAQARSTASMHARHP